MLVGFETLVVVKAVIVVLYHDSKLASDE